MRKVAKSPSAAIACSTLEELLTVRLRESAPGVYRLDHDAGQHDDRAVSLGLAALALTEQSDGTGVGMWSARDYRLPVRGSGRSVLVPGATPSALDPYRRSLHTTPEDRARQRAFGTTPKR